MAKNAKQIYQIKITLLAVKPKIWRRILIPASISLPKLHDVIQISIGWRDSHLHQFVDAGVYYGIPDPVFPTQEMKNERNVKVSKLLKSKGDRIMYEYDFGDSWQHEILLEKVLPFDRQKKLPVCIDGDRSCPPEDCGGSWGYQNLLEIMVDPDHDEYEEMNEWLGDEFEPEKFDAAETTRMLSEYAEC